MGSIEHSVLDVERVVLVLGVDLQAASSPIAIERRNRLHVLVIQLEIKDLHHRQYSQPQGPLGCSFPPQRWL